MGAGDAVLMAVALTLHLHGEEAGPNGLAAAALGMRAVVRRQRRLPRRRLASLPSPPSTTVLP